MEKKNPDPWAIPDSGSDTIENKTGSGDDAFDATQWHEVTKGETLWRIAEQYYGDGTLYSKIFEANRDVLRDPNRINIGQKLRIP
ncbi:MAG TPA: LysM peptidoglycan-binding domain-containing protein [Candidatus Binatia bacterium]|jgi:nucleoid-associated protein YgaU